MENEDLTHIDDLTDDLLDLLIEDIDDSGEEKAAVLFMLWIKLARMLAIAGWTSHELAAHAAWHAADELEKGAKKLPAHT